MRYTLDDCIANINQVLNYPSVSYTDISHFFDQAISELNTELQIGLRPISEIYKQATFNINNLEHFVMLSSPPDQIVPTEPTINGNRQQVYFDSEDGKIHYLKGTDTEYTTTSVLYGIYTEFKDKEIVKQLYITVTIGGYAYWTPYAHVPTREVNLLDYLPYDWVTLYLIPYICFKYAVRDGDVGANYLEDMQQGFQQLQKGYNVPSFVMLNEQAGKIAYRQDVADNLPKLNIKIPTRAIYDDMKTDRIISAQYGSMYDNGGWGI